MKEGNYSMKKIILLLTLLMLNLSASPVFASSGWIKEHNDWYYYTSTGNKTTNSWIGDYYLKNSGKMAHSEWIFDKKYDSWFYLKADGSYARNQWEGDYYLKNNGAMARQEWIFDKDYNNWFFLKNNGAYARNEWEGNYYLKSNGAMAKQEWIGSYYVNESGLWFPNATRSMPNTQEFPPEGTHYKSCKEVPNNYRPLLKGHPGYSPELDRDHDGKACELKSN